MPPGISLNDFYYILPEIVITTGALLVLIVDVALSGPGKAKHRTGLAWVTKLDKPDFIGKAALVKQKQDGVRQRLVGFVLKEKGFPRHGYEVRGNGEPSGEVTSGTVSPSLEIGVGLAYVSTEVSKAGNMIEIVVRDKAIAAEVTRPPFYKEGTVRKS